MFTASSSHLPVIISGPSAVGKGTLQGLLLQRYPEQFELCCSHTTRKPRVGEVHGKHYWFVSKEEFAALQGQNAFIETNQYSGNFYGTSFEALKVIQDHGKVCLLDIDINGVQSFKATGIPARFVFVLPPEPKLEVLRNRLRGRGTEDPIAVQRRMEKAENELKFAETNAHIFDLFLVNDNLEKAFEDFNRKDKACRTGIDQVGFGIAFEVFREATHRGRQKVFICRVSKQKI